MTRMERRNLRNGILFALPYLIGGSIFMVYPLVMSVYYSLCHYNIITPPTLAGLANYRALFFRDEVFWKSVYNTLYFTAFSVPLSLILAVGLAVLLNQAVKGQSVFRTVFFLPTIVPIVASAVLWLWVLNPESGLINGMLREFFNVEGPGWIADIRW